MQTLQGLARIIYSYLNALTKPTTIYVKDKQELELLHNRNKAFIIIHLLAASQYLTNLILGNGDFKTNLYGATGTLAIGAMLLITIRFGLHPQVFNTTYNIYALFFGLLQKGFDEHGIFGAWLAAPVFPIFIYFMTGSIRHFAAHAICQAILMNVFYQDLIKSSLAYMSTEETIKALTHYSNESISYCIMYTALTHFTLKNAVHKIQIAEKQKEDLERQRNFLLGFSHELRNLINSLMGNVKLASLEKISERVKDLLLNAEVCSELLLHLVNNILDTGKVEIGDLEINPVSTRVYDTIERIWGVCSELIKRKNLNARVNIQKDIPQMLMLDHYRLTQIFLNLIGNSIKFTDVGHININVEWIPDKESIDDECFEPYPFNDTNDQDEGIFEKRQALAVFQDNYVSLNFIKKKVNRRLLYNMSDLKRGVLKVSVMDTGCGILPKDLGKLFQRFQQGTSDPSKKKLGTGLGLFITRELCRRMHGEVKVFSKPELGSVFEFCIPLEPVADDQTFFFDERGMAQQKFKAMVVDDEQLSQNILREFLTKLNVDVVDIAENGLVAYRKLVERIAQKEYLQIVTMDINMSIMDGKISAQKIRELEVEKNLEPCLLIMVSGNCGEAEIQECLDKNGRIRANAFLKKPVRIEDLGAVISKYIAQRQKKERPLVMTRMHTTPALILH